MIQAVEQKQHGRVITPPIGTAVHESMTNDEYHSLGNWSHSQLRYLPHDPEMFEWKYILRREERKVTRSMELGSAFHAWLLEGIEPMIVPASYLTKSGSMRPGGWDALKDEYPGVTVLKSDEAEGLRYARENCYADPEIRAYLESEGHVEHSLFSVDEETNLPTQIRLDKLCKLKHGLVCFDLKYSADVQQRWIDAHVTGMDYYRQAGMYWEHVEKAYGRPVGWVFLFVKNAAPYTPRLVQLMSPDIALGVRHTHAALCDLRDRLESGDWHGEGYGKCGVTNVARWKWEETTETVEGFAEFDEFMNAQNSEDE